MNGPQLKDMLRAFTQTTNYDNLDDSLFYSALTQGQRNLMEYIKSRRDTKKFFSLFETSLVSGVNKYLKIGDDGLGSYVNIVDSVKIKYSDEVDYVNAVYTDVSELEHSFDYYIENQSETNPMYMIIGDDLHIFPAPKVDVTDGLVLSGSVTAGTISATTLDEEVLNGVLGQYHLVIVYASCEVIHRAMGELEKAQIATGEYKSKRREMVNEISTLVSGPRHYIEPDLSQYINY